MNNNDLLQGKIKKKTIKNSNGDKVEETTYNYTVKQKFGYEEIYGLRYRHHDLSPATPNYYYGRRFASYSHYKYKTNIVALPSQAVTTEFGTTGETVGFTSTVTNTYGGQTIMPTEILTSNADGSQSKVVSRYLPDILNGIATPFSPAASVRGLYIWRDQNKIDNPIEYVMYRKPAGGVFHVNQAVLIVPKRGSDFASSGTNTSAYLSDVEVAKLNGNLTSFSAFAMSGSNAFTKDSRYFTHMSFLDYDNYGNVLLQRDRQGVQTRYTWGSIYNHSLLTSKEVGYNSGLSQTTTYTHLPLIGMSTMTDARGLITYYEYDIYERLIRVKDHDLNTIEEYEYNMINEQ